MACERRGGLAVSVRLAGPAGIALDANDNLYVAEWDRHRVRRVDARTGTITTVAGNGWGGYSGDGGRATDASLYRPQDVAVGADGDLFICDTGNCRVRRVDAGTGLISTVAGSGNGAASGDGGPAVDAGLQPSGAALDAAGNLYMADPGDNRIRMLTAATGLISTVAGSGTSGFWDNLPALTGHLRYPGDVAVDAAGNLYIADVMNGRVRRVDASTELMSTVAGGGNQGDHVLAVTAGLFEPESVALDSSGNLYISDAWDHRVRRVDATTGLISTVAGDGAEGFSGDGASAPATRRADRWPPGSTCVACPPASSGQRGRYWRCLERGMRWRGSGPRGLTHGRGDSDHPLRPTGQARLPAQRVLS